MTHVTINGYRRESGEWKKAGTFLLCLPGKVKTLHQAFDSKEFTDAYAEYQRKYDRVSVTFGE